MHIMVQCIICNVQIGEQVPSVFKISQQLLLEKMSQFYSATPVYQIRGNFSLLHARLLMRNRYRIGHSYIPRKLIFPYWRPFDMSSRIFDFVSATSEIETLKSGSPPCIQDFPHNAIEFRKDASKPKLEALSGNKRGTTFRLWQNPPNCSG